MKPDETALADHAATNVSIRVCTSKPSFVGPRCLEGHVDAVGIGEPQARVHEGHVLGDELLQAGLDGNVADNSGCIDGFGKTREPLLDGAALGGGDLLHGDVLLNGQKPMPLGVQD